MARIVKKFRSLVDSGGLHILRPADLHFTPPINNVGIFLLNILIFNWRNWKNVKPLSGSFYTEKCTVYAYAIQHRVGNSLISFLSESLVFCEK